MLIKFPAVRPVQPQALWSFLPVVSFLNRGAFLVLAGHVWHWEWSLPEPSVYPECSRVNQYYQPEAEGWRGCPTQEKCRYPLGHPEGPGGPVTSGCKAIGTENCSVINHEPLVCIHVRGAQFAFVFLSLWIWAPRIKAHACFNACKMSPWTNQINHLV